MRDSCDFGVFMEREGVGTEDTLLPPAAATEEEAVSPVDCGFKDCSSSLSFSTAS